MPTLHLYVGKFSRNEKEKNSVTETEKEELHGELATSARRIYSNIHRDTNKGQSILDGTRHQDILFACSRNTPSLSPSSPQL